MAGHQNVDAVDRSSSTGGDELAKHGFVFYNGHFIPGPYTIERTGDFIRVNNIQIDGQQLGARVHVAASSNPIGEVQLVSFSPNHSIPRHEVIAEHQPELFEQELLSPTDELHLAIIDAARGDITVIYDKRP
ncbi:MAG: hypothetical protein HKN47_23455, partial [Pirellulaceae bacterium]|nr:hypothetical protein [Pirellulaceae bacterium]